jgi:hypothetical protein
MILLEASGKTFLEQTTIPVSVQSEYIVSLSVSVCALPIVVIEWSTLLPRIREVQASNLDPETGYPG